MLSSVVTSSQTELGQVKEGSPGVPQEAVKKSKGHLGSPSMTLFPSSYSFFYHTRLDQTANCHLAPPKATKCLSKRLDAAALSETRHLPGSDEKGGDPPITVAALLAH